MTLLLPRMLKPEWWAHPNSFRPIYVLMTGLTLLAVAWVVGRAPSAIIEKLNEAAAHRPRPYFRSRGAVAGTTLVILILLGYLALALKWEDFADYDDAFFTLSTLRGINLAPPVWPASGRFFPLGRQEFNFIRHFAHSAAGYHVVPITELLIICCILYFLDEALSVTARMVLAAVILIVPSIVTSFTGLVFPEINVVFWLACLMFFVKLFEQTQSIAWAAAAAICAQNMIYYKETAFLLLLGFAAGKLVLRCRRADGKSWDYSRLRDREARLDMCLVSLGLLFLLYYEAVMLHHASVRYSDLYQIPWDKALLYYLKLDLLALLFVVVALRRAYLILRLRLSPSPFWDGLALGGVACYLAYLRLRLCMPYYLAPVDFIAVLYVGRFVILSWEKMRLSSKLATSVLVSAVLLQSVALSAFRVYERENLIHAKVELASAIAARSLNDPNHVRRLFFPFSSPYIITEFASYLIYRGVRVEGFETTANSAGPKGVTIVSRAFTEDGLCVNYRDFICHAPGSGPAAGDLVIEMPDDLESRSEITSYRAGGELSFCYEPHPRVPQWLLPSLSYLHIASLPFWFKELPDRWLHASMTTWK
jgi:hypothetical protein